MEEYKKQIAADNISVLKQGRELIQCISTTIYRSAFPGMKQGTIGAHFRHCLEIYQCLINGLDETRIDYENRPRSKELETDPERAIDAIDELITELDQLCYPVWKQYLKISYRITGDGCKCELDSSIERELKFMISHTIHHYALIKMILLHYDIPVDDQFGVAPSTLAHWKNNKNGVRQT
ncbi:MAG: hypothetical protein WD266_07000 [Balneolales bacterium]